MINAVKDESVKKHTGKTWREWVQILDTAGARAWTHQEIAAHLKKKHRQTAWWQQIVANGYEVAIGKRIAGQTLKGDYSATITKSLAADAGAVWKWCCSQAGIESWLNPLSPVSIAKGETFEIEGGIFGEIRTVKPKQRVRFTWCDSEFEKTSTVQLHVLSRGPGRSMIVIQHDGITTAAQKTQMRAHWRRAVESIAKSVARKATPSSNKSAAKRKS